MKVVTIIGARPQFVKAAVVSREFQNRSDVEEVIIHTGQHFDENMSEVFFNEMNIPRPKYNLGVSGLGHGAMTGRMLEGIEKIMLEEKPDWCLVYGDTNSTLAGALAAKKLHIKLAHVEAGLRSYNMNMPEEINRILTDRISDLLFVPTDAGVKNLEKEGFSKNSSNVVVSGDVMYDAAIYYSKMLGSSPSPSTASGKGYILATCHRAENTDDKDRLKGIIGSLNKLHNKNRVVLPLHPRTNQKLKDFNLNLEVDSIDPVGYLEMVKLIKGASLIITDSGGLQKEAYFFEKPCITIREETEWVELIESGCNVLAGADEGKILEAYTFFKSKPLDFSKKFYGSGAAGNLIVETMENFK